MNLIKQQPKTHETFVIGFNEKQEIIFLKSYDYAAQKDEAQSDLTWVIDNCKGWFLSAANNWKMEHENEDGIFKINIPTSMMNDYLTYRMNLKLGIVERPVKVVKPIAKKSKNKIQVDKELKKLIPIFLARPENRFCNIQINENCTIKATTVNHTKRRGINEVLDQKTWEPSCMYCNSQIESEDKWARENGHLKSKFN